MGMAMEGRGRRKKQDKLMSQMEKEHIWKIIVNYFQRYLFTKMAGKLTAFVYWRASKVFKSSFPTVKNRWRENRGRIKSYHRYSKQFYGGHSFINFSTRASFITYGERGVLCVDVHLFDCKFLKEKKCWSKKLPRIFGQKKDKQYLHILLTMTHFQNDQ